MINFLLEPKVIASIFAIIASLVFIKTITSIAIKLIWICVMLIALFQLYQTFM